VTDISVVIPCLNEASTIADCVRAAQRGIAATGLTGEIIVADNGSTDGSVALAEAAGAAVVVVSELGYGAALLGGLAAATGRFVVIADGDSSYDLTRLTPLIEPLAAGFDLVVGNRFSGQIMPGAMPLLHQYVGNPFLSALGRVLYGGDVRDFHCGLRAFRREAIAGLSLTAPGMEFASEMIIKANLAGLRAAEVPVTLYRDGRHRKPHLRPWRDGWRHFKILILYRF